MSMADEIEEIKDVKLNAHLEEIASLVNSGDNLGARSYLLKLLEDTIEDCYPQARIWDLEEEVSNLESENCSLSGQVESLESDASDKDDTISELEDKLQDVNEECTVLQDKVDGIPTDDELSWEVESLKEELENLLTQMDRAALMLEPSMPAGYASVGQTDRARSVLYKALGYQTRRKP